MLWEFFTLAKVPYPGIVVDELYQKLIEGYKMKKPNYAIPEIYDIMLQCWEAKPTSRPSFTNLVESIGELLEESVRRHYISLNTPYLDMNEENLIVNPGCSKNDSEISNPIPIQDHSHIEFQSPESDYEDIELSPMLKHEEDAHLKPIKITHSHVEFPSPESDTIELTPMLKHEEDANLKLIKITSKEQNLSDGGKQ